MVLDSGKEVSILGPGSWCLEYENSVYVCHRHLVLLKQVRPELLGVTKVVMSPFMPSAMGTLTSSHLIPNIRCRVLS